MNLVKLLKVGRSLKDGKTNFGKYQFTQQTLPKFASTVRPSGSAPVRETLLAKAKTAAAPSPALSAVPLSAVLVAAPVTKSIESKVTPAAPSGLDKTQKIAVGTVLRRIEEPASPLIKRTLATRIGSNLSGLKEKLIPNRSRSKHATAPVQTEWALEKVTVARNDLSEADLEVVAAKQPRKITASNISIQSGQVAVSRKLDRGWIKKTTGLFKTSSPFAAKPQENALSEGVKTEMSAATELAGRV